MKTAIKMIFAAAALLGLVGAAAAQTSPAATTPQPISITTGNTFQVLLAAGTRRSLTIQNNNASDSCNILIGGPWANGDTTSTSRTLNGVSLTAAKGSIVLAAGGSYVRYFPYIPNDQILATCATSGDSLYMDFQ